MSRFRHSADRRRNQGRHSRSQRVGRGDAARSAQHQRPDVPQSKSGEFNMVYRRDDGTIGWVEPQPSDKGRFARLTALPQCRARSRLSCESIVQCSFPSSSISKRSASTWPPATSASCFNQLAQIAGRAPVARSVGDRRSIAERERLGSTGFGGGVAIPHGKIEGLDRVYALFARLADADRLQGGRRPAGRPGLSAAVAARCGRRASEGAGGGQPGDPRRGDRSKSCAARAAAMRWPRC